MSKEQYINEKLVEAVYDLLKDIRNEDGRTQGDVAGDIFDDIKHNFHIGRLETTGGNMRISTLFQICKTYKISIADFFSRIEETHPDLKIK